MTKDETIELFKGALEEIAHENMSDVTDREELIRCVKVAKDALEAYENRPF
jgi:hypothetical protein